MTMNNYTTKTIPPIQHSGYVDQTKASENIRILSLNPRGVNPWNNYRMEMLIESCKKYQIDILLLCETQVKWTAQNIDKMEHRLKQLGREIMIIGADSNQWDINRKEYLPGGLLSAFLGKSRALIKEQEIYKSKRGNWMAVKLNHKRKTIALINIYRIPSSSSNGNVCSLTQYNLLDGEAKSTSDYRKEILKEIKDYVASNEDIDDVLLAGDLNQNVASSEIQAFFREIGVQDSHSIYNNIQLDQMDRTYIRGSFPIDTVAMTSGLFEYVEGVQLLGNNEIIMTDHRSYVVDINIEDYFNDHFSTWNEVNKAILNPSRQSHRTIFYEELENQLNIYNIEATLLNPAITNQQIEQVDEVVTLMLNQARKKVEGMQRNIPYSYEKARRWGTLLYWKSKIRELKGIPIDEETANRRITLHGIDIPESLTLEIAKERLSNAQNEWEEIKVEGQVLREKYLLDHAKKSMNEEEMNEKSKKKILQSVRKSLRRQHAFKYLTKHAGKGPKNSLKRLHVVDENNKIINTITEKEEIEKAIFEHNTQHYRAACDTAMYKDKIYDKLQQTEVRNAILDGTLNPNDCDSENVYKFLALLKQPINKRRNEARQYQEITQGQWIKEVKRSKKHSASSIFSRRTYSVYKCALDSARMTFILVTLLNIFLKRCYYPKRWLKLVDTTLEKGKGPIIGKLRNITLIEGDMQIGMRMHLDSSEEEMIENDKRFSDANFGSRKNYAITTAILQKRLIFDNSSVTMKHNIYTLTDLQSCYDRQLPNIGSIVEESVGRNRNAMILFTKIMPKLEHHVSTAYGVSQNYYGGEIDLVGTGQGNKMSGDICRDISCLIIKQLEIQNLGICFLSLVTFAKIFCSSVSFVDDTDLAVDGDNAPEDMQIMLNLYNQLHVATGGKIQEEKSKFFSWIWKWKQGQKVLKNVQTELLINNKHLQQIDSNKTEKSLGVMIGPSLKWIAQFEMMKNKLERAMWKLKSIPITVSNSYLFYNMYLIQQVYFGCGIIKLSPKQESILRKISEPVLLRKLKLSEKFPRDLLYARKSALGVGLMRPSTIIAVLALQLYLGHKRKNDKTSKMIQIIEENESVQYGYNSNIMTVPRKYKIDVTTWCDEVAEVLEERSLKVLYEANNKVIDTKNKTIMELAIEYINEMNLDSNTIAPINHVRNFKKMMLPCELVGMRGVIKTYEYEHIEAESCFKWGIAFPKMPRPSKKSTEIWRRFLEWLAEKTIETFNDFDHQITCKYQVSSDEKLLRQNYPSCKIYKIEEAHGKIVCIEEVEVPENSSFEWKNSIACRNENGRVEIYNVLTINVRPCIVFSPPPFNQRITKAIEDSKAYAASDASVKNSVMTGFWCIKDDQNQSLYHNNLYHKDWSNNTIIGAEAIVLLELIEVLERKGRHINHGKVQVGFDNRIAYQRIVNCIVKAGTYAQDAGAEIAQIQLLLKEIKFDIELSLVKGHERINGPYSRFPLKYLIKECDTNAKYYQTIIHNQQGTHNLKFFGRYPLITNDGVTNRSIKEAVRIIDAKKREYNYAKEKLGYKVSFVDVWAREAFRSKAVTTSMIKCASGFNHYGLRNELINNKMIGSECPRCSEPETWDHVILCHCTKGLRKQFIVDLLKELFKNREPTVTYEEIFDMVEDILVYLNKEDEENYTTSQHMVGMDQLFRGYVVKVWKGANFSDGKYKEMNKILIRHCVKYYKTCWDHRNEEYHNETKQRRRILQWYQNIKSHVESNEPMQVKTFVSRNKIQVERCKTEVILQWIYNVKKMIRKVENLPQNDIRRYFGSNEL